MNAAISKRLSVLKHAAGFAFLISGGWNWNHTTDRHAACSFLSVIAPRMEIGYFLTVMRDETVLVNLPMTSR